MAPYQYSSLDEEAREIRILTLFPSPLSSEIRITIEKTVLAEDKKPQYEALSYVSGSSENLVDMALDSSTTYMETTTMRTPILPTPILWSPSSTLFPNRKGTARVLEAKSVEEIPEKRCSSGCVAQAKAVVYVNSLGSYELLTRRNSKSSYCFIISPIHRRTPSSLYRRHMCRPAKHKRTQPTN